MKVLLKFNKGRSSEAQTLIKCLDQTFEDLMLNGRCWFLWHSCCLCCTNYIYRASNVIYYFYKIDHLAIWCVELIHWWHISVLLICMTRIKRKLQFSKKTMFLINILYFDKKIMVLSKIVSQYLRYLLNFELFRLKG